MLASKFSRLLLLNQRTLKMKKALIETERMYLREWNKSDAKALFQLNNDPDVLRYTGDEPFASIAEAGEFIDKYPDYKKNGYGRWAMVLKSDHSFIGWCGLKLITSIDEVDVGYRLQKQNWNKGFATEASIACLKFGFEILKLPRIIGRAMKLNTASIRVLEKSGLSFEKEVVFEEHEGCCYAARRRDWLSKHL
jgi:ribosomal-protein-alanine N-acetyltransferase